jgi:dGTPase
VVQYRAVSANPPNQQIAKSTNLASYAMEVAASRGRRFPEPSHAYRDDYQRDRDRVIHSRAFRRLENKTQVFTHRYSDHFRNRLTHTIEVAQITRTVAGELGLNVELAETLALVHDIGHPPFGHSGEKALDGKMREHGLFFDHNIHALRIVEHFEVRYAAFRGLNLTFEVREGIIKHSRDYSPQHFPELAEYLLDERPPLEAQLVDLTDEIAYNTADLDDGFESGFITLEQIRDNVELFEEHYRAAEAGYASAPPKLKFNEALRRMFDTMVGDLIRHTAESLYAESIHTPDDVRLNPKRLASFSGEMELKRAQCKKFLYDNLYYCPELRRDKEEGERVINEMFDHWLSNPRALPPAYREQIKSGEQPARVVCDYIAGMTDNFIRRQWTEAGFGKQ